MNSYSKFQRAIKELANIPDESIEKLYAICNEQVIKKGEVFIPLLIQNHGMLVNVSSGLAYLPLSIEPNYCATKAALHSMTQSMRMQYGKMGVEVVEILYPEVNTPFQEGHATARAITPKIAASEALRQMNQGRDEIYVKGSKMLYQISRWMPKRGLKIMNGFIPEKFYEILLTR